MRAYNSDGPQPTKYKNGDYSYRNYEVKFDPAVVSYFVEWSFCHEDYDGAPDANDDRCGFADTAAECFKIIDELEDE